LELEQHLSEDPQKEIILSLMTSNNLMIHPTLGIIYELTFILS
jgi:hypothetical protein